jgi:hypothetical protein
MADSTNTQSTGQALLGLLTGNNQPTVNTNIILDQKSTERTIIQSGGVVLFLIIIWYFGRWLTNPK